jgi:hypothetical protein
MHKLEMTMRMLSNIREFNVIATRDLNYREERKQLIC